MSSGVGIKSMIEEGRIREVRSLVERKDDIHWSHKDHKALAEWANKEMAWLPNKTVMELIDLLID